MVSSFNVVHDIQGSDGSPGSSVVIDSLGPPAMQFKAEDQATVDGINPCVSPQAGTNYSFAKSCYMKCVTPPATQVDNVQIYSDGANGLGTGIDVKIGGQFPTKNHGSSSGYKKATGTVSVSGNEITTFYTGISSVASIFTYIQGSALSVSISETGAKIVNANDTTNYFVLQMWIQSTAIAITETPLENLTIQWDEI